MASRDMNDQADNLDDTQFSSGTSSDSMGHGTGAGATPDTSASIPSSELPASPEQAQKQQHPPQQPPGSLSEEATPEEVRKWLVSHGFSNYTGSFEQYSGADLLRLTLGDLKRKCRADDGICLHKALHLKFEYTLQGDTLPSITVGEKTITYLTEGQEYKINIKEVLGKQLEYQDKHLRSTLGMRFSHHDKAGEKAWRDLWKVEYETVRILEIPETCGLEDINHDTTRVNQVDFTWDSTKETLVIFKVNTVSTELSPNKSGRAGMPFRLVIQTYCDSKRTKLLHLASCQIKVYAGNGARRQFETDKDEMAKTGEKENQPERRFAVLTEVPLKQDVPQDDASGTGGLLSS